MITELLDELRITRARGYALDDEEVARGMCCFGAPIRDASGIVTAAVSVVCVKAALDDEHYRLYADGIVRLADHLSATRPVLDVATPDGGRGREPASGSGAGEVARAAAARRPRP